MGASACSLSWAAPQSDAAAGKISNESPVGSVLLGHKKGDVVETTGPTGRKITMTILKLEH